MSEARLLIPLADLPGPVPVGAPVVWQSPLGWQTWGDLSAIVSSSSPDGWTWQDRAMHEDWPCALDLSPPPLDANGFPLRIDGLDVAAGMLGTALGGRPPMPSWFVNIGGIYSEQGELLRTVRAWCVRSGRRYHRIAAEQETHTNEDAIVPALADIDPTSPDAPRLAMVACFRARVWEGR